MLPPPDPARSWPHNSLAVNGFPPPQGGRSWRRRHSAAGVVAVLGLLLGACSDGNIVASDAQQLYVRLPSDWTVHGAQAVETGNPFFRGMDVSPEAFFKGASASPHPKPSDIFSASGYPWAIIETSVLTGAQQMQMSVEGLSNVLIPIDQLAQQGATFQQLFQPQVLVKGALHGSLVAFEYGAGPDTAFDYRQATWVNNATTKAWVLIVGCSPACYEAQQATISRVIDSFYVSDRGAS